MSEIQDDILVDLRDLYITNQEEQSSLPTEQNQTNQTNQTHQNRKKHTRKTLAVNNKIILPYKNPSRQVFYYNGDYSKPILAGGVIFYRYIGMQLQLLMIYKGNVIEDIGGKTEFNDLSIYDTVAREVSEETNGIVNSIVIYNQLLYSPCVYMPNCKYVTFFVKSNSYESMLTSENFGDKEIKFNLFRKIMWINIADIHKYKTAHRVNLKNIYNPHLYM